jgi:predicted TIM-barrel fold metal-dependent hydrolase
MVELSGSNPRLIPLATVYPGEEGTRAILEEAFDSGLRGVKLHCHVQCLGPDHPAMREVYEVCAQRGLPLVMHAGREPKSPAYKCDPHLICSAGRIERVLVEFPKLKLCVPHLGADEYGAYQGLLERHDNLWLDTTMMVADYFPFPPPPRLLAVRPDRILFGTDFPNIPYAWDRELRRLAARRGPDLERILGANARHLFAIPSLA